MIIRQHLERVVASLNTSVVSMCADGDHGKFGKTESNFPEWDRLRLSVIAKHNKTLTQIVWFDFWGGDMEGPPWLFDHFDFRKNIALLARNGRKVILFGDVPSPPTGDNMRGNDMMKRYIVQRYRKERSFAFMNNLYEVPEFRKRRLNVEARLKEVEMHARAGTIRSSIAVF